MDAESDNQQTCGFLLFLYSSDLLFVAFYPISFDKCVPVSSMPSSIGQISRSKSTSRKDFFAPVSYLQHLFIVECGQYVEKQKSRMVPYSELQPQKHEKNNSRRREIILLDNKLLSNLSLNLSYNFLVIHLP